MKRLFVDTFFFFAFLNANDSAHQGASIFYDAFDGELVTTEWILTELGDGLAEVSDRQTFIDFHTALRDDPVVKIILSNNELFTAGVKLYAMRRDKEWSLTNCISFVVMQREELADALV
jgi:predicted nucleic acid-binding protein